MSRELSAAELASLSPDERHARAIQRAITQPWTGAIVPENLFVSVSPREGGYHVHKLSDNGVARLSEDELARALRDHPRLAGLLAIVRED